MKMYLYKKLIPILGLFLLSNGLTAQLSFTDQTQLMPSAIRSGVAMGVTDLNGDYLDDIIRLDEGYELRVLHQQNDGSFLETILGIMGNSRQWTVAVADIDHNGYKDILTGDYSTTRVSKGMTDGVSFETDDLPGNFFAQGSNFADINNDGWLDAFVCDDNGESQIYGNDGAGNLSPADEWIDMSINGSSGEAASGNYGSVWTDFDNDGDLDLYIAKCRQNVSNTADERRINKLFVNDGNNNYTEAAEEYGLRIGWQSWTADFQDIDNDGDMDCFITNHDYESQLLENDGTGHFTDITASSGLNIAGLAIQGMMRDFDNDGFVDILVAGTIQYLYRNNGDKTFELIQNTFSTNNMESYALGDLNNDGFVDIYAGYAYTFNNPSNIEDVVWMNDGNDNNWFKVHLEGVVSNLDGIGARIEIYGDWGMQVREVRAGESYGITNSNIQYFGLGDAETIDHVIVKWPSGIVDVIDGPAINGLTTIVEGACQPNDIAISANGPTSICSGETVTLTAPEGANYYWSTGANTQEITVSAAGNYSVVVENADGCFDLSAAVTVIVDPIEIPSISVDGPLAFCEGGSVMLTSTTAQGYTWSNNETTASIEVTTSGTFSVTTQGQCDEFESESVTVDVIPNAPLPVADDVIMPGPGDVTLEATGTNLFWYDDASGTNLIGTGPSVVVPNIDMPTFFYVSNSEASVDLMEPHDHEGSAYSGNSFNGQVIFNALTTFKLKSVKVYTDVDATRIIELRDASGILIDSKIAFIEEGESRVELDFIIPPGQDHYLTTNTGQNQSELGFNSPRLQRSSFGVDYPYTIDNVVEITNSDQGNDRYYYFYDWEVQTPTVDCVSDLVEVAVIFDVDVIDISETDAINVYPNPTQGAFNIDFELVSNQVTLRLMDLSGKLLLSEDLGTVNGSQTNTIQPGTLAKGSYLLEIQTDENRYFSKLVVQ